MKFLALKRHLFDFIGAVGLQPFQINLSPLAHTPSNIYPISTSFFFRWLLRLGDQDHLNESDDFSKVEMKINQFRIHPLYKKGQAYFDVAIIDMDQVDAIALNVNFAGAKI